MLGEPKNIIGYFSSYFSGYIMILMVLHTCSWKDKYLLNQIYLCKIYKGNMGFSSVLLFFFFSFRGHGKSVLVATLGNANPTTMYKRIEKINIELYVQYSYMLIVVFPIYISFFYLLVIFLLGEGLIVGASSSRLDKSSFDNWRII